MIEKRFIARLMLSCFRNYKELNQEFSEGPVVLSGENGAGKTNILEAISFLAPGRGLRNIVLAEADYNISVQKTAPWVVSAQLHAGGDRYHIGTGRDPLALRSRRVVHIDGENVKGHEALPRHIGVLWLTPLMDRLFMDSASSRRRFLDRLATLFDSEHAPRLSAYERALRERSKVLEGVQDNVWMVVLEERLAQLSVAIAAARNDAIHLLQKEIATQNSAFPKADLDVRGETEQMLKSMPALQVEEILKEKFFSSRLKDRATGRTHVGVHRSDLVVIFLLKNTPARLCSTGEQKVLLLSIVLAAARAKALLCGMAPLLLLDEVVAHLDPSRRQALFDEIVALGVQAWLTGTDREVFAPLSGRAQFCTVEGGGLFEWGMWLLALLRGWISAPC